MDRWTADGLVSKIVINVGYQEYFNWKWTPINDFIRSASKRRSGSAGNEVSFQPLPRKEYEDDDMHVLIVARTPCLCFWKYKKKGEMVGNWIGIPTGKQKSRF